ncbi:MAG: hypothetical protein K0R65_979 [Crocinitomicaceae bacterium]|jgi:hypothetical protein|nr:hypothetical protein [Crocinitomicaceae bacterium]
MKKNLFALALLFGATAVISTSCKKEKEEDPVTPTPAVNTLCDGNGTSAFYPLTASNSWTYTYLMAGQSQNVSPHLVVNGTEVHNSKTYTKIEDETSVMYINPIRLRVESSNNDIYYYNESMDNEYVYVPAAPTLNQSWSYGSYTRKVTNLSASVSTSGCSYTGLLEISNLDGSTVVRREYFKKGLGLVYVNSTGGFFTSEYKLNAVTLN